MDSILRDLFALLVWPGLLSAALLGWFFLWLGRKALAQMQGRQGPPFYQSFFDFVKLLGKQTVIPAGVDPRLFHALPVISLVTVAGALALIPAPGSPFVSFNGDLILLIYLMEMPALVDILAGYITRSPYAQVGAAREAAMMLGYNLPFLTALIALSISAGSTRLAELAAQPFGLVQILAALALLLAMPARMKTTPFSIPNAETEIVAGPHLEYNGVPLGLFELAHGLERVALAGLFAALLVGTIPSMVVRIPAYLLIAATVILVTTLLAAGTARLKVQHALRFYWQWGALAALATMIVAIAW